MPSTVYVRRSIFSKTHPEPPEHSNNKLLFSKAVRVSDGCKWARHSLTSRRWLIGEPELSPEPDAVLAGPVFAVPRHGGEGRPLATAADLPRHLPVRVGEPAGREPEQGLERSL